MTLEIATCFDISVPNAAKTTLIQQKIDQKTKPLGALGILESVAKQIAMIQSQVSSLDPITRLQLDLPVMVVFAGDHGIAAEGVSIAPSAVTQQMVNNFLTGGAAINCFCRTNGMDLAVVDAGILLPIDDERLRQQSLGLGTHNFSQQAAMSIAQVKQGIEFGASVSYQYADSGSNIIAFGEMGIGNSSAAAAVMAAALKLPAEDCVGMGTGIDNETYDKKLQLIETALRLHRDDLVDPLSILACVGGFEIVQMVGAMLAAAERKMVILIDGFIASVASLIAIQMNANAQFYMIFSHCSAEKAHALLLEKIQARPLIDLNLRLGEGTGAALAFPLIQAAASFYNDMASFAEAGIDAV
jgi:nicotinate-nucleotide--dimethylbenzimidazole phosphoribosyltransferase